MTSEESCESMTATKKSRKRQENKTLDAYASASEEERPSEKGAGRMPWHQEPKKDVTSCDKFRGGADIPRSGNF